MPSTYNILVIDDDPTSRRLRSALLISEGLEVTLAASGAEGLESALRIKPDLILLDVMMPDMDGYTVCEQLKTNPETREIPVAFMSNLNDRESLLRGYQIGAIDFIEKSTEVLIVLARIKALLHIGGLTQDKTNLLRANKLVLSKIENIFNEETNFKNFSAEGTNNSKSISHELDRFKSSINDTEGRAFLDNIGNYLAYSSQAFKQVKELLTTISKLQIALTREDVVQAPDMEKAGTKSVFTTKRNQEEIDELLKSLEL